MRKLVKTLAITLCLLSVVTTGAQAKYKYNTETKEFEYNHFYNGPAFESQSQWTMIDGYALNVVEGYRSKMSYGSIISDGSQNCMLIDVSSVSTYKIEFDSELGVVIFNDNDLRSCLKVDVDTLVSMYEEKGEPWKETVENIKSKCEKNNVKYAYLVPSKYAY